MSMKKSDRKWFADMRFGNLTQEMQSIEPVVRYKHHERAEEDADLIQYKTGMNTRVVATEVDLGGGQVGTRYEIIVGFCERLREGNVYG